MMVLLTMLTRRRRWRSRQPLEFLRWMGRYEIARKWHRTHCQVPALVISNGQQMAFEVLGGVESAFIFACLACLLVDNIFACFLQPYNGTAKRALFGYDAKQHCATLCSAICEGLPG